MLLSPVNSNKLLFGLFEMDVHTGELWKAGYRVKLQAQPFKVLAALIERPGEVITREELQARIWGTDTVVDFDRSLGTAINKVREALGDSADHPQYVETLARRGYRFLADVHRSETPSPNALQGKVASLITVPGISDMEEASAPTSQTSIDSSGQVPVSEGEAEENHSPRASRVVLPSLALRFLHRPFRLGRVLAVTTGIAGLLALAYWLGISHTVAAPLRIVQITHDGNFTPTEPTMERLPASATDGVHLFASTISNGRPSISSVALSMGLTNPMLISDEVAGPTLGDISPDGTQLLLRSHLSPESEQALWVVPTLGGSAQRVGDVLAHDATWMPDGKNILFANGSALYVTPASGLSPVLFAKLPGRVFWMRWRPRGDLLRFTILDPIDHLTSIWQLSTVDKNPHQILSSSGDGGTRCCGVWLADGSAYIFQVTRGGATDLWSLSNERTADPRQLTNGPLDYEAPVAARSGQRIYFIGEDQRSDLQRIQEGGKLTPVKGFLAGAVRVEYTRDGRWVAWTDGHGALWRSKADGSDKLQLATAETLNVFLARWSPDGSHLALMAREPGEAWQIYTMNSDGGGVRKLLAEPRNAADPSWSPDGKRIVFGRINDFMGKEDNGRSLQVLDLSGSKVSEIPGSQNMFSPRWSPDGRYIAALTLDQRQVKLYDVIHQRWQTLRVSSGADPAWSFDSRLLFVHAALDPRQMIECVHIPEMRVEEVAQLATAYGDDSVDFIFSGLSADGIPLVRLRTYTGNVFAMDLK